MEDTLRDIKPLLELSDNSYYFYIGLIVFAFLALLVLILFLFRYFWKNREENMKKVYLKRLKNVDWSDSKQASYEVTFLAHKFIDEVKVKEMYEQTLPLLEQYKYRKEVECVDEATLRQYKLLVHIIDESI